jgi:hypothetical protein
VDGWVTSDHLQFTQLPRCSSIYSTCRHRREKAVPKPRSVGRTGAAAAHDDFSAASGRGDPLHSQKFAAMAVALAGMPAEVLATAQLLTVMGACDLAARRWARYELLASQLTELRGTFRIGLLCFVRYLPCGSG